MRIVENYLLLFFIYSILGWIIESTKCAIEDKKFVNRGFLIGPYCPIYGFGALIITILIKDTDNIFLMFSGCLLICGLLEYLTSYFLEKMFKIRWWDYSKEKFQLNGRICLENLVYFGVGGILILYFINPFIFKYLNELPNLVIHIISLIILINLIIDICFSLRVALALKNINREIHQDRTEEFRNEVKKYIMRDIKRYNRIFEAFPHIKRNMNKYMRYNRLK